MNIFLILMYFELAAVCTRPQTIIHCYSYWSNYNRHLTASSDILLLKIESQKFKHNSKTKKHLFNVWWTFGLSRCPIVSNMFSLNSVSDGSYLIFKLWILFSCHTLIFIINSKQFVDSEHIRQEIMPSDQQLKSIELLRSRKSSITFFQAMYPKNFEKYVLFSSLNIEWFFGSNDLYNM